MRTIHGAAVVFAATLVATVGNPGSAEAFFFLPMLLQQSQPSPSINSRDRSPGDNNRWRRSGGDRGKDEAAQPVKPSTSTRAKRDEESSSTSSGKSGKAHAKSEASTSQASRTRGVRQEPPPSKSSGHANASVRRESRGGAPATPPAQPRDTSADSAQATSSAHVGSTLGDTFDEKLGEVFQARIDALLKQSN